MGIDVKNLRAGYYWLFNLTNIPVVVKVTAEQKIWWPGSQTEDAITEQMQFVGPIRIPKQPKEFVESYNRT